MPYIEPTSDFTLQEALLFLNVTHLRTMMAYLSVPKPLPTTKSNMVAVIEERFIKSLRHYWEELNEIQQMAVREVLYESTEGLNFEQFRARYSAMPSGLHCRYSIDKASLPIRLFLYYGDRHQRGPLGLPTDLMKPLKEFAPPPPEVVLTTVDELPKTVARKHVSYLPRDEQSAAGQVELIQRNMERTAMQDLFAVLRLIDGGRISVGSKTLRPSVASLLRIAKELDGGDFFDPAGKKDESGQLIGPVRAFAWPWLVQAGKLAQTKGSKLVLTKAGHAAFGKPAAETLRHLWGRWIMTRILDEFSRIDCIKGQYRGKGKRAMAAVSDRRIVIEEALVHCPVGQWVRFNEFSRFMRAEDYDFSVTRNPWTLYIGEHQYGNLGYSGCHDWHLIQARYLLCLLFEYAATLGLIDIAYTHPEAARTDFTRLWGADNLTFFSRYDGLEYFRLTGLGAYCLNLTETYEPVVSAVESSLRIFPDRRISTEMPLTPDEQLMIETFATVEAQGVWRLDHDKTLAALENGHNGDDLRTFLTARDDQPLPETVEGFLRNVERSAHALREKGMALLIQCTDRSVADRLVADKHTSKLCLRAGETHLVVPTAKEGEFRKAVRKLGYGLPRG